MGIDFETLSDYLAQILNDDINLSFSETEKYETEEDKSIIYGLVCLHEDMQYYKSIIILLNKKKKAKLDR